MSQTSRSGANRTRRKAAEVAVRRRRRWGFGSAGVAILLVTGVILGLHFVTQTSRPARAAASTEVPGTGHVAPNGTFTTLAGTTSSIASLRGTPTLVWLVTTWCSSCQAGPSIGSFATTYAGAEATNPDWSFGVASAGLTRAYDPQSNLEVYYLLNAKGQVTYMNAPLVSTMPQLLQAAGRLK